MKNYIRYVTNGNVLSYEGGEATENGNTAKGNMAVATSPEVSQALLSGADKLSEYVVCIKQKNDYQCRPSE